MNIRAKEESSNFQKRLVAIVEGPASHWQDRFADDPKHQSLAALLAEFRRFARNYFVFFARGEPVTTISHELHTALSRLQREWSTISRACGQREIPAFAHFLEEADTKAAEYHSRITGAESIPLPITYFEKLYAITRHLFTPYPLLSIPLQFYGQPDQWQAVAHEMGHFIYWNLPQLSEYQEAQARLRKIVMQALTDFTPGTGDGVLKTRTNLVDTWIAWLEETFADVCGTLLAGPPFASAAQRVVEDETAFQPSELIDDDGDHPAPYLRPYIALAVLDWIADNQLSAGDPRKADLRAVIEALGKRWTDVRELVKEETHVFTGLPMSLIEDSVPHVVGAILEAKSRGYAAPSWVQRGGQPTDLAQLIDWEPGLVDLTAALQVVPASRVMVQTMSRDVLAPEPSVSFEELLKFLRAKHGDDDRKVREALISLELSEEEEDVACRWRRVRKAGTHGVVDLYKECV